MTGLLLTAASAVSSAIGFAMIHIHKISGEEVVALDEHTIESLIGDYGNCVRGLKYFCEPLVDASIHRQRLLFKGETLSDHQKVSHLPRPSDLQVVILPFVEVDPDLRAEVLEAIFQDEGMEFEMLLRMPIDPNTTFEGRDLEPYSLASPELGDEPSLLSVASFNCRLDMVKALLNAGADTQQRTTPGLTPLHLASLSRDSQVAGVLCAAHADKDAQDPFGRTPLWFAALGDDSLMVHTLLRARANADIAGDEMQTPLWMACVKEAHGAVLLLLGAGANANISDDAGRSPLFMASGASSTRIAEPLLKAKADFGQADLLGRSPLWIASWSGRLPIVKLLVKAKADLDQLDVDGRSPLCIARQMGKKTVVKFLESAASARRAPKGGKGPFKKPAKSRSRVTKNEKVRAMRWRMWSN